MDEVTKVEALEIEQKNFTDSDIESLKKNVYKEGKTAGIEMTLKELKRKYEIEEAKDFDTLINGIVSKSIAAKGNEIETLKSQLTGEQKDLMQRYEKEKTELQKLIAEKESLISQSQNQLTDYKIDSLVSNEINNLMFEVPESIETQGEEAVKKYLAIEKQKAKILFKNSYQIKFDSDRVNVLKDSELITDKLQNPESLSNVIQNFAKEFNFGIKTSTDKATRLNGTKKATQKLSGMQLADFEALMSEKGIRKSSNEYIAQYADWKKANK